MAETTDDKTPGPWLSGRTYDFLKFVAQVLLPALGTLYFAVAGVWGLPFADQVVGTVLAVDTFLGVVLGISTAQYRASNALQLANPEYDGVMTIHQYDEHNGMFELNFPERPSSLVAKDRVVLKVESPPREVSGKHLAPVGEDQAHQYADHEEPQDPARRYTDTEPGDLPRVPPPV